MKVICLMVGLAMALGVRAQTFDEWFEQNSTRKKYNEEQVTALQTFINAAEKGYNIVESGLQDIKGLKSGEFSLHSTFYASLGAINPAVGGMGEVAEIAALQVATAERVNSALSRYRQSGLLGTDEVTLVGQAFQGIINAGIQDINTLLQIITAGTVQMSDDQRMAKIHALDVAARERYGSAAGMTDQADLLVLQRQAEAGDIGTVRGLYGVIK